MKRAFVVLTIFILLSSTLVAKSVESLLEENECMKCHQIMGIKFAPSFSMISKMNSGWFGASKNSIKNSIKNGSKGKYPMFSNAYMPAFSKLSKKELNAITDWIVKQGSGRMYHKGSGRMHHRRMMY